MDDSQRNAGRILYEQSKWKVKVKVAQLCPTPDSYDPTCCILKPEYWSGYLFPSPGDLPNPGIGLGSPALQAVLHHPSHNGSPRVPEWVAYPFSSRSSRLSCIAGRFFTN